MDDTTYYANAVANAESRIDKLEHELNQKLAASEAREARLRNIIKLLIRSDHFEEGAPHTIPDYHCDWCDDAKALIKSVV